MPTSSLGVRRHFRRSRKTRVPVAGTIDNTMRARRPWAMMPTEKISGIGQTTRKTKRTFAAKTARTFVAKIATTVVAKISAARTFANFHNTKKLQLTFANHDRTVPSSRKFRAPDTNSSALQTPTASARRRAFQFNVLQCDLWPERRPEDEKTTFGLPPLSRLLLLSRGPMHRLEDQNVTVGLPPELNRLLDYELRLKSQFAVTV